MKSISFLLLFTLCLFMMTSFIHAEDAAEDVVDLDDETESTSADDLFSEKGTEDDEEKKVTDETTTEVDEEEEVEEEEEGEFDVVDVLGADLACSACELTLDVLVKNFGTAESAIRRKLEDEAAEKEKEKEEADKTDEEKEADKEDDEDKDD